VIRLTIALIMAMIAIMPSWTKETIDKAKLDVDAVNSPTRAAPTPA